MIIFGMRGVAKMLAMINLVCRNCGNPSAHRLTQYTRWFTLFFIPVFPVSRSRSMTCTFCGQGTKLTKEQAAELIAGAQGPAAPAGQQAPAVPSQQITPPAQPGMWTPPAQQG